MGRVARYKKIKSFDPFSKKNNGRIDYETVGIWGMGSDGRKAKKVSKTVEKIKARKEKRLNKRKPGKAGGGGGGGIGRSTATNSQVLDAEYGQDDFDLNDLVGSLKKEAPPVIEPQAPSAVTGHEKSRPLNDAKNSSSATSDVPVAHPAHHSGPDPGVEEERLLRQLKLDRPSTASTSKGAEVMARMPGESKEAYRRRSALEVRRILRQNRMEQMNPEKRQKKKEFLNNKKRKKGGKGNSNQSASATRRNDNDDDDDDHKGNRYYDSDEEASLGEKRTETRVVFGEQVEAPPVFRQRPRGVETKAAHPKKHESKRLVTAQDIESEQEAMEMIRRKAQAHYSVIKAKRRQDRDFHL